MPEARVEHAAAQLARALAQIAPLALQHAHEGEARARLPEPLVHALIEHGLFRIWIPRSCGGFELELGEALALYEAAAAVDGSLGWAVMIGAGGGLFAAYLGAAAAREIFAPPAAVIAGSGAPLGRAEQTAQGYRVSGRWRYASGAHYASTFTANCIVTRGGAPLADADGQPLIRAMAFRPEQVRIIETWDTSGMRATGSHDFEVEDAFVVERHSFSLASDERSESGRLYRLPFRALTELPVVSVAVGIARHALEEFARLAASKTPAESSVPLARDSLVRAQFAESSAAHAQVAANIAALTRATWQAVQHGDPDALQLARITAGCVSGAARLRAAIADLMPFAGMTGIYRDHALARAWRDLQAVCVHASLAPRHLPPTGAELLG